MCTVILLRGLHDEFPVLIAANRDEARDRPFSPPGLTVGARCRMLSPKDKRAGGTWIGVNDRGMVCAITNAGRGPAAQGSPSRGQLPHLALDCADPDAAMDAVAGRVAEEGFEGFRLVVASAAAAWIGSWIEGRWTRAPLEDPCVVFSNRTAPGELEVPGLERWATPAASVHQTVTGLEAILRRDGSQGGPALLVRGEAYGTVSSSVIAMPAVDPRKLVWRFSSGSPDVVPFRNYGNLGRRLLQDT